jgi:hypothetical protein
MVMVPVPVSRVPATPLHVSGREDPASFVDPDLEQQQDSWYRI